MKKNGELDRSDRKHEEDRKRCVSCKNQTYLALREKDLFLFLFLLLIFFHYKKIC